MCRYIKFWKGYYCRWNPRMRPQDSVHLRHAQLLSLRDQLQSKVSFVSCRVGSGDFHKRSILFEEHILAFRSIFLRVKKSYFMTHIGKNTVSIFKKVEIWLNLDQIG